MTHTELTYPEHVQEDTEPSWARRFADRLSSFGSSQLRRLAAIALQSFARGGW